MKKLSVLLNRLSFSFIDDDKLGFVGEKNGEL